MGWNLRLSLCDTYDMPKTNSSKVVNKKRCNVDGLPGASSECVLRLGSYYCREKQWQTYISRGSSEGRLWPRTSPAGSAVLGSQKLTIPRNRGFQCTAPKASSYRARDADYCQLLRLGRGLSSTGEWRIPLFCGRAAYVFSVPAVYPGIVLLISRAAAYLLRYNTFFLV